jgi:hypothetical protein
MLNVAIGVGSGGGAPRLSDSCPGAATEETGPLPGFTAAAGVFISLALRCFAFRRRSSCLAFPVPALSGVPCRLLTLRIPVILDKPRPLSRTRLLTLLLVRALFFLLVTFMATWDKTLLFTPLTCQLQPSFLKYLRLLARKC